MAMDIGKILTEYDGMFGKCGLADIEAFLKQHMEQAKASGDFGAMITLLNEIIGFCRDTTQREKALFYCDMLLDVMHQLKLQGRVEYATSLLNIANAYRAFGLCKESVALYEQVYENYQVNVEPDSFAYASLYNNWSLVYQELENFDKAKELLLKALAIVDLYDEAVIPQATTRTNLATTLLQMHTQKDYEEAMQYLSEALTVFERDGGKDFHYGAALVAMGDAHFNQKEYEQAADYYKKGMAEIEKHVGRTDNYARVQEKFERCQSERKKEQQLNTQGGETKAIWIRNLEKCRKFYENYGKAMIQKCFPEYESRIAVGLAGEGSDCFGFDDTISTDHDYEVGFCMWLTDADYKNIGTALQKQYERLMEEHGNDRGHNPFLAKRRGVFSINGFCNGILATDYNYETLFSQNGDRIDSKQKMDNNQIDFLAIREENLAVMVNGEVFRDDLGMFTSIREYVKGYYPEKVWRLRLSQSLHEFSQYAQSNYPRMMARKDAVTANMCVGKAIESAMDIAHLLNRTYAPYYKWKKKSLERLSKLQEMIPVLEELVTIPSQSMAWENVSYDASVVNRTDRIVCLFEQIAGIILRELKEQDLVDGNDTFLERYCQQIIKGKNMDIIENIVDLEWAQFDKVKNEGGRASCQDDYATFSIMRKSQYLTWNAELLESYYNDLAAAQNKGWNLIMEKYARMMKTTAPEKYAALEKELPVLSDKRIAIQEEIIKIQVAWMEEFAGKYPKMAGNARSIHTSEDNEWNTSYETYLRGELGTYSENTFVLYGRFITELMQEGKNLAYETMSHTAKLYGYESVEDAESRMW